MNNVPGTSEKNFHLITFVCCIILSAILFYPILNKNFAGDDFFVLNRLCLKNSFWIQGFFRPVGDITLIWTYKLFGFQPFYYYAFNIGLHGFNGFLVFVLCRQSLLCEEKLRTMFAVIAALLFIVYPFHLESIAWAISRSSSLGATFGLLSLLSLRLFRTPVVKYITAGFFYFAGLACFENIFLLPLIAFVFIYEKPFKIKRYIVWGLVFSMALAAHLALRIHYSGVIWGSYGEKMFTGGITYYFANVFKVIGRLYVPPTDNSLFSMVSFIAGLLFLSAMSFLLLYRYKTSKITVTNYIKILLALLVSLVIPFLFGVSTHTSESDRLLYFPSVFWAILVSFLLIQLAKRQLTCIILTGLLFVYQLFFLRRGVQNWLKASETVAVILDKVKQTKERPLYIINLPDEYNGAYIFRNGFTDALQMYHIDTAGVVVVNHLTRAGEKNIPGDTIRVSRSGSGIMIPPSTGIYTDQDQAVKINASGQTFNAGKAGHVILFWDKSSLQSLHK
jgi:protein O-mannosyl-transferase